MASSLLQTAHPMSTKEISEMAANFQFNSNIQVKYWLRTADTLLREGKIYEQEHNDQQAYLLLMRYAALVSEHLSAHPQARLPEVRYAMSLAVKEIPDVVMRLEALKPRINARYDAWQRALERRSAAEAIVRSERPKSRSQNAFAASDPAVAGNSMTLGAAENSELAVKMAHNEFRRRDARRAGVSSQEEQERRTAGLWDDWEAGLSKEGQTSAYPDDQMRLNMEASRRRMDGSHDIVPDGLRSNRLTKPPPRPARPEQQTNGHSDYRYPSITKSQPLQYEDSPLQNRMSKRPAPPPKLPQELEEPAYIPAPPPRIPAKTELESPLSSSDVSHSNPPPSTFTFRPSAYLENGQPLRTVFLPPTLRSEFLAHASKNTRNNLETCGMLCGTLMSNALFVSKVVIPEQKSTSDTCETTNEGAFFDYCANEDLMVLGWIHTHPSQTCFMSSRDLHTHAGYQIMMPESVAIVCAPSKNPSWGVFRLTDPPGMQSVLNCRKTGLFHPHEETNVYTDALRPGHVFEADGLPFEVVDQRP